MRRKLLFGADFADYPIMQEMLLGFAQQHDVLIGGRSGRADTAGRDHEFAYFDWQPYQRADEVPHATVANGVVDAAMETEYAEAWRQFARALDRVFLDPLPAREAERYFWALVAGLATWISERASTLVVWFAHTPHFPWHIVFFHVCQRLKVPVYIFKRTQLPDGMFFDTDLVCGRAPLPSATAGLSADAWLDTLDEVSGRLKRSHEINRRAESAAYRPMGLGLKWKLIRRYYRARHGYRNHHYFRQPWWRLYRYALRRDRERRADLSYLTRHARRDAPSAPYIYFALHYQPERTTVPEAGFYHDQLRAITALARAMPNDWTLVVKEHPRQLGDRRPDLRCLHYGREPLYQGITELGNTVLMDAFASAEGLIAGAELTASCNGSSVFEGLKHGIPGLTFVPTWHSACASAPAIGDMKALPGMMNELAAKTPEQVRADLAQFIRDESRHWFVGANDDRAAQLSARDRNVLVASMRTEVQALLGRTDHRRTSFDLGPERC
ncbi:hypothetical protein [Salinisphaera hydrothermalis]|uniref:hypothetical protein n=1 Tax=Salinisphaera hydrothermalis TaxID=563188 RepID=UPI00333E271A